MKKIILSDELCNDLLHFLNKVPIQNNTIGESKSLLGIVNAIEKSEKIKKEDD